MANIHINTIFVSHEKFVFHLHAKKKSYLSNNIDINYAE